MKTVVQGVIALVIAAIAFVAPIMQAHGQTYPPGTYYSEQHTNWPPLPFDPYPSLPVYSLGDDRYLYNDTSITYPESATFGRAALASPSVGGGGGGGFSPMFSTNDFYIELLGFSTNFTTNVTAFSTNITTDIDVLLRLHGTVSNELYQLLSTTNLSTPGYLWTPGEIITGSATNNYTDFDPVLISSSGPLNPFFVPIQFFRAHHADVVLQVVQTLSPAVRPLPPSDPATNGTFNVQVENVGGAVPFTNFQFTYTMSGGAVNGVDYTNISGTNTISASGSFYLPTPIDIWPIVDNSNKLNVEAIMTLNSGTGYLVSTDAPSAVVEVD